MYAFDDDAPNFFASILENDSNLPDQENFNFNHCLITHEPFTDANRQDKVTLECGHSFLHSPLFEDVWKHKSTYNLSEVKRVEPCQLRCPYCRKIQNALLQQKEGDEIIYGVNTSFDNASVEIIHPFTLAKEKFLIRTALDKRWTFISQCQFHALTMDCEEKSKCGLSIPGFGQTWICENRSDADDKGRLTKCNIHLCLKHCVRGDILLLLQKGIVLDLIKKKHKQAEEEEYAKVYRCSFVLVKGINKGKTCRNRAQCPGNGLQKCHLHITK